MSPPSARRAPTDPRRIQGRGQHRMKKFARMVLAALVALVVGLALTSFTESSQDKENQAKQDNYDHLVAEQPAGRMEYSPTREAINQWIKTWGKRGKLSYVYIQNARGEYGYFIM